MSDVPQYPCTYGWYGRSTGVPVFSMVVVQWYQAVQSSIREQVLSRKVERFRGGLACKAHRLLYHSPLGTRVIKKKKVPVFGMDVVGEALRVPGCGFLMSQAPLYLCSL